MDRSAVWESKRKYLMIAAVTIGVYLFMKFLSPVVSPFLLAFLLTGVLCKLTNKIPIKIKKSFLTVVLLLLLVGILTLVLWWAGSFVIEKCSEFAENMPAYEEDFCIFLRDCSDRIEGRFGIDGTEIENFVLEQVDVFIENMEVKVFPTVMNKSVDYVKNIAGIVGFLAVIVIAVFLMLKDYEKLVNRLQSNHDFAPVWEIGRKVLKYIKTYVKAQAIILLVISIVCAIGLMLLGIRGGIVYGILAGFMDMLPFIGTGIMLVPIALFQLFAGEYWKAILIIGLYGLCALLREFLEPKLIGNKVGIWPVGILFAVFAGLKLFGVTGIIKGPIGLVIICETYKYLDDPEENRGHEEIEEEKGSIH